MKYWEIIADNLSKAGWSLGCVSAIDSNGRTIWIADAHRGDGKRFVAGREKKSQRTRLRERPPRVGQGRSQPGLMRHEKKARPEHDLAFLGEIAQLKVRGTRSISPSVLELERQPPCVAHKLQVPKQ